MSTKAAMPPPEGTTANLEHPADVLRTVNFVIQALTLVFCSTFVGIRAYFRLKMIGWDLTVDDYLTYVSWILMVGYSIGGIFLSVYGGGYHTWEVSAGNIERFYHAAYVVTLFYAPMTLSIKLSLLALISRVFAPYKKRVQGIYVFGGLLTIYYIISFIMKIRICWPISAYWKGDASKCLNQQAIITADSIISTVTDAIILVLPLPMTWSLQLPLNKKLRVVGILAVGGLATGFSAWRLHVILTEGKSPDATVIFIKVVISGNAEAGLALICTCLPAFAAQFSILKGRVGYGSSHGYSVKNDASGSQRLSTLISRRDINKERRRNSFEALSDEAELVTYAQRNLSAEGDVAQSGGIMRKVEVTHKVTYATSDSDRDSKAESRR